MASEVGSAGIEAALGFRRQQSSLIALKGQIESDAAVVRLVEEAREQQQAASPANGRGSLIDVFV